MNRYYFLALGGMLGLVSLLLPWFYFAESGTLVNGQWGFGPIFYSEPTKEVPGTSVGLALQRDMSSPSTSFWIWHDLSFWLMIAALGSVLVVLLFRGKTLDRAFGTYVERFAPFSLMILSVISWTQFAVAGVENVCLDTTCLSGLVGRWTDPGGMGAINWGLGSGFFVSIAAATILVLGVFLTGSVSTRPAIPASTSGT